MLLYELLKEMQISVRRLRHPRGLQAGKASFVRPPFSIPHGAGIVLGSNTTVHVNAIIALIKEYSGIKYNPRIVIGNGVYVGRYLFIAAMGEVTIGDGCVLSDYIYINDSSHGLNLAKGPIMSQPLETKGPIHIGRNCFLGYRAAVLPGVTLGEGCVVGINSVVTRSFPAYSMVAGAPARIVRTFDHASGSWVPVVSSGTPSVG
jgi:acetyltransferase-like isoleucine patch superfamily enzyme